MLSDTVKGWADELRKKIDPSIDLDNESQVLEKNCGYLYNKQINKMTNKELDIWHEICESNQD